MTHPPQEASAAHRVAHVVSEATSPTFYAPALLIVVSISTVHAHGATALLWGLVAAAFVGALPLAVLQIGARRGHWSDRHVRERAARAIPLLFATGSVAAGLAILLIGGAPRPLSALVLAMLAGVTAVLCVSRVWKISIHSSVAAGAAVILTLVGHIPGAVIGVVLLALAGWARLVSGNHTLAQVLAGMALGAATAYAVFAPLR